eukprot:TRINITY_DN6933_c0_g1_i1.p1 TRINITY_DN6933_c0_g1~~TRINITY_DN6933_c0_g1_i1.p1  ORF type:complete len:656 (-),score=168.91 TRINITY_DN6933_c0_g1_i1:61-2028(-)
MSPDRVDTGPSDSTEARPIAVPAMWRKCAVAVVAIGSCGAFLWVCPPPLDTQHWSSTAAPWRPSAASLDTAVRNGARRDRLSPRHPLQPNEDGSVVQVSAAIPSGAHFVGASSPASWARGAGAAALGGSSLLLYWRRRRGAVAPLASAAGAAEVPSDGPLTGVRAFVDRILPGCNWKKILPLAAMSFLSLFNYTILRDVKDVLIITAPQSGAEIIPFIKTYVNLPLAVLWTILYSKLSNHLPQPVVFTGVVTGFLAFFGAFAFGVYPMQDFLHPIALADALQAHLPASFMAPIALFRHWTFSLFYVVAEMWGSVVVATLFWGLVNQICTVEEAKVYYPLLGFIGNIAPIFGGQYVSWVSQEHWGWTQSLDWLMGGVLVCGALLLAVYAYVQRRVVTDPNCVPPGSQRKAKQKTKLTVRESAAFLVRNRYILSLALLVICYGTSMNIVEVTWKANLRTMFPDPSSYSAFMGHFSSATGVMTVLMMAVSGAIFQRFGWGVAAAITPLTIGFTGLLFFSLILAPAAWAPVTALFGMSPLMLAVLVGAFQNIVSKSARFALFDPCKEMAYIPLDVEARIKGKAAIDVIGNPLGKSGGAFLQQALILGLGSLTAATPWLGVSLCLIIWGCCALPTTSASSSRLRWLPRKPSPPRRPALAV